MRAGHVRVQLAMSEQKLATRADRIRNINERYLTLLLVALFGYAVLGRGFAYAGIPPVFIGEILLVLGLLALLRSGCLSATLSSLPNVLLILLMIWVLIRAVPYIGEYGLAGLRDTVIVLYGLYAFVIAGLLLQVPDRLLRLIESYGRFIYLFIAITIVSYPIQQVMPDLIPVWPNSGIPLIALKPGDIGVHLAGISLFLLLGFGRFSLFWLFLLFCAISLAAAQGRGGTLAILLPLSFALLLVRANSQLSRLGLLAVTVVVLALILDVKFEFGDRRGLSARQILTNLTSILSSTESGDLDDTKEWRLEWWQKIIDYTINGRYFWGGKGFGVNLADVDGYQVIHEGTVLRSPHNASMTILARSGVPGILLWLLLSASWAWTMISQCLRAHARQDRAWSRFFLFIFSYWLASMINATFDVALEGPMMGIWTWCLFGIGIGASMIYQDEIARYARPASVPVASKQQIIGSTQDVIMSTDR